VLLAGYYSVEYQSRKVWRGTWHAHMKQEMYSAFCWEALEESEQWVQIKTPPTSCHYMSVYTVKGFTNTVRIRGVMFH